MNKFYKVVFCKTTGVMKAVSETAKSGKKTKSVSVVATALAVGLMSATSANAAIEDDVATNTAIIGQHTQALEQINGALEEVSQLSQNITQAGLIVGTADINEGSMAVGAEAVASGDSAIAVGNQANVKGVQGLAVGSYNDVTGRQSTAIGSNNTIRGIEEWWDDELFTQESQRSTLIGVENNLTGSESIAIGVYNRANNDNVTITGSRNSVDARESGAYGQGNFVGSERVIPTFLRVDDGATLRMVPSYAIQSGSYAYGNMNEVIGDKSHAVGNSNNVMGEGNGVLGNGNTLSNDTMFIEPPRWDVRTANMERVLNSDSNGSFLVGNQNEVRANNTHAVGNQNTIRNDRNVTIGNSNRVDFLEEPIFTQPQRMSLNNDTSTAIVGEEPLFIQPQRIGMIGNNNTSTAIVGEGNNIYAAGVHIVGTENSIDQAYSYVVGAGNQVDSDNGLIFGPGYAGDGSAIMGSDNYIKSQGTAVLGSNNSVYSDSHFSVVSGSRNEVDGLSSSVVGGNNYTEKDVGGTFGTFNKVTGNYGILELIENAMLEAEESEGGFQGIDTNGDGVIDIATLEELEAFQASILDNGSYAYGNGNIVEGEGAHVTGNTNEVAGDNSGAFGNKNAIGTVGFYNQETESYIDPIKNNNTFAYGNSNVITKDGTHVTGNNNTVASANSVVSGSNNKSALALDPDAPQTGHDVIITGNDNINNSTGSVINGNKNKVFGDTSTVVGTDNTLGTEYDEARGTRPENVTAIGNENRIYGKRSTVVGYKAVAHDDDSVAIGTNVTTGMSTNAVVLGSNSEIAGGAANSIIIGANTNIKSGAQGSTAIGANSNVFKDAAFSTVVGYDNRSGERFGNAFGDNNQVFSENSTAIGSGNTMSNYDGEEMYGNYSFGSRNFTTGSATYVIGKENTADGFQGYVFGNNNTTAKGSNGAVAIGDSNLMSGDSVVALGGGNVTSGNRITTIGTANAIRPLGQDDYITSSQAFGDNNVTFASETQLIGNRNIARQEKQNVIGRDNTANSKSSTTIGENNIVGVDILESNPVAFENNNLLGNNNNVQANDTFVGGNKNTLTGDNSSVIGADNVLNAADSGVQGNRNTIEKTNEYDNDVVGSYITGNDNTVSAPDAFIVGNKSTVGSENSVIVGNESSIGDYAENSAILGASNAIQGSNSAAVGSGNTVEERNSGVLGNDNYIQEEPQFFKVNGERYIRGGSYAIGNTNSLFGSDSHVLGNNNSLESRGAVAVGNDNRVNYNGQNSAVLGHNNSVEGYSSTTTGSNNNTKSDFTFTAGNDNTVASSDSSVIGHNNTVGYQQDEVARSIGDGESDSNNNVTGNSNTILASDNSILGNSNASDANGAIIVGSGNTVDIEAADSIILGSNASSTVVGGIAIGNNSVADRENAVSVGSAGFERQITNVADGTQDKDAVNLGQLNASIRDTTGGKNLTATRTDTGYEVALNDAITLDSVTTGNTVVNTDGVKAGDVFLSSTTGLDNAGNRVTSVGDATLRSDAVNYGQFQDGMAGTIKSVTGDENITATTDAEKNVSLVLNKDLVADSLTAGDTVINNAGFTNGATTVGNTGLKVGDVTVGSTGLDNAGNRVTSVGDAIADTDAVNYGQFKAGLTDTTAGKNISVKRTDTGYEVSTVEDMSLTSVTTGDTVINNAGFTNGATTVGNTGLQVGDVTVASTGLDNAGNRVTSVGDATLRSDAVNYGQFQDGLAGTIKSVTGDENITATTDAEKNVSLVLNKNLVADSLTTGTTIINTDGVRAGDVFMSSASGLNNAGFTVSGVGDAVERDEAINKGQFDDATKDMITSVDSADDNIYVNRDGGSVWVGMSNNISVESVSTGGGSLDAFGLTVGSVNISKESGISAGNKKVTGVANAVNRDEAINKGQFDDALEGIAHTTVDGDSNIVATKNETGYDLSLSKDVTVDSVTAGENVLNSGGLTVGGVTVNGETGIYAGDMTVSGVRDAVNADDAVNLGQVSAIDDRLTAENVKQDGLIESNTTRITKNTAAIDKGFSVGDGETANKFELGDTVNITADSNTKTTTTENGVELGLADNITIDSVTTGNALLNTDGLRVGDAMYGASGMRVGDVYFGPTGVRAGDVILSNTSGLNNAGFTVSGVGNAINRDEAVNKGQLDDALDGIQHTTVTGDANINATKNDTGYDLSLNKDLTVDSVTTGNTVVNGNGVAVGDVTLGSNGLNNGGNKVTGVAAATEGSDAVNLDQFNAALNDIAPTDIKGDENITVSKGNNGYEIGLNKDVVVDSVNAGGTIIDSNGVTVGDVTLGANGLNNAGNTITGVGAGVKDDDAVNMGQLNATNAKVDKNTADITATNDRITVETGRLDAVNAAQDKVIAGKLDREEFLQDQQRQDEAIKGKADQAELDKTNVNVSNNTTNIDKNAADIKDHATELDRLEDVKADKADLDKTNANVSNNTTNIDKNAADIKDHATELDRLEDVKADKADLDKTNENVTANADKNKDQDKTLSDHQTELERLEDKKADKADIDAKADTDYVDKTVSNKVEEQSSYFNEKVSNYEAQIKRDMETMQKDQAKVDTAQDVRIDANTQMINDLGYKVDNMEDKLSAGIASSVAMALMPNAINPGEVRLAGGTGYYNGENAIAVGLTGATESGAFTYKIAGSYTDTGGAVVGGGISYRVW